jgi:hypothetical protein
MGIGNFVPIFKITSFAAVYFMSPRYEISRPKKTLVRVADPIISA